jgi:hypothetical protein
VILVSDARLHECRSEVLLATYCTRRRHLVVSEKALPTERVGGSHEGLRRLESKSEGGDWQKMLKDFQELFGRSLIRTLV